MRIRKRQVPFPLSSLSPIPLSDPAMIKLHSHGGGDQPKASNPLENNLQPSDHPNQRFSLTGGEINGCDCPDAAGAHKGKMEESSDMRKGSISLEETSFGFLPPSLASSSIPLGGRWYEGEKEIPLKKRKGDFEGIIVKDKRMKMKTKMNEKCGMKDEVEETEENPKRKSKGGGIMEGSRCSRVNGRGWRCCQQTLVGYSLCEHHLGKGRLRSMTSVRTRTTKAMPLMNSGSSFDESPLMERKKRMKIGTVKARSMSSLLGQQNNEE